MSDRARAGFLDTREQQDGDRRVESDIEPVVQFLMELLGDPMMLDFNGEHLLKVKRALPAIPTPRANDATRLARARSIQGDSSAAALRRIILWN